MYDLLSQHLSETLLVALIAQSVLVLNGWMQRRADRGKTRGEAAKLTEEAEQIGLKSILEMLNQATRDNQSQREEIKDLRRDLGALRDELERDKREHAAQLARLKAEADQQILRLERENGRLQAENTQLRLALGQAGAAPAAVAAIPAVPGAPAVAIQHTITTTAVPAVEPHERED